jgi:hypothetical protein
VRHSFLVRPGGLNGEDAGTEVQVGLINELYAAHPDGQIFSRKFKATFVRVPGLALRFLELSQEMGLPRGMNWDVIEDGGVVDLAGR